MKFMKIYPGDRYFINRKGFIHGEPATCVGYVSPTPGENTYMFVFRWSFDREWHTTITTRLTASPNEEWILIKKEYGIKLFQWT
jgi:hypothetical protein